MFLTNKSLKKQKLYLAITTGALVLSALTSSAQAQSPSVSLKKGQLQQAGWYKSAPQVQIVDDGPVVHDYRTAPHEDQAYQIPIGPAGTSGRIPEGGIPLGNGGPQMMRMAPNSLPQSGFGTNMQLVVWAQLAPCLVLKWVNSVSNMLLNKELLKLMSRPDQLA